MNIKCKDMQEVKFATIEEGKVFLSNGIIFMRLKDKYKTIVDYSYSINANAVKLSNGELCVFNDEVLVIPVPNATLEYSIKGENNE